MPTPTPTPSTSARRYCSVCGFLSSEPSVACPQCSLATAHTVPLAPAPILFPRNEVYAAPRSRGPPAWVVIGAVLVIILVVVLVALALDGVFSPQPAPTSGELVPGALALLRSLRSFSG